MKRKLVGLAALAAVGVVALARLEATAQQPPQVEFIDIRWDGVDRLCVVFPDGKVEFLGREQLKAIARPEDVDRRAFYMTIALNRMAARGYEFVAMISDEIVMKRTLR